MNIEGELIKSAVVRSIIRHFTTIVDGKVNQPIVYKEKILQHFERPSFFVREVETDQKYTGFDGFRRRYHMAVTYHPQDNDDLMYERSSEASNQLMACLDRIDVPIWLGQYDNNGDPIMVDRPVDAWNMSTKWTEHDLQCFVTYQIRMKRIELDRPTMDKILTQSRVKEEY